MNDELDEEYTVGDRRRVVDLLKNCYASICTTFEVKYIIRLYFKIIFFNTLSTQHISLDQNSSDFYSNCLQIRDMEIEGNVSDILNKSFPSESSMHNSTFMSTQREPPLPKAGGDPDLRPICSYEIAWLVRMFHDISSYCNKEVSLPSK